MEYNNCPEKVEVWMSEIKISEERARMIVSYVKGLSFGRTWMLPADVISHQVMALFGVPCSEDVAVALDSWARNIQYFW